MQSYKHNPYICKNIYVTVPKRKTDTDKLDRILLSPSSGFNKKMRELGKFLHLHMDNYNSKIGRSIEASLFILNFAAIILFMINTLQLDPQVMRWLKIAEISVVSIFILEYAARLYVAKHKLRYVTSVYAVIDILSIIPVLIEFIDLSFLRIFRWLRFFRLIRILRFQRMFKQQHTFLGKLTETEIVVTRIILTVFTIIFVSAGLIWSVETRFGNQSMGTIFDAMYFSIVTLSTVGYGDITPLTPLGKAITTVMILSGVALIPYQLTQLAKILIKKGYMDANDLEQFGGAKGAFRIDMEEIECPHCKKPVSLKH